MSVPAKDPRRFVETHIDDETIVMVLATGDFFSMQDHARAIWELIDGRRDEADIVAELAHVFEPSDAAMAADVADFLAKLRAAGLLADD